jgi:hypothetical protein
MAARPGRNRKAVVSVMASEKNIDEFGEHNYQSCEHLETQESREGSLSGKSFKE